MNAQTYRAIAMVVVLIAIGAAFAALTVQDGDWSRSTFLSVVNLRNVLLQCSITTVTAVGMTLVIIAGGIDLSVGSVVALCTVVFALVAQAVGGGTGIIAGAGACLAAGALFGVLNGALVVHIGAPPFIVTLGTMLVGRGLAFVFAGGRTIHVGSIGSDPFTMPTVISLGAVALAYAFLTVTRYGRYVYATGGSEEAARLSGVPVSRVKLVTYVVCGLCAGLGAIVYLIRMAAGNPLAQEGLELYAIAAAIVGGTSLNGGQGNILGTLIGALIMGVLANGLGLLSVPDYWQKVIIGSVIVVAVGADMVRQRLQARAESRKT